MTQKEAITKYLKEFGSITTFQAFMELGITQLAARICDLEAKGVVFKKEPFNVTTRYGKKIRCMRYSLAEV